MLEIEQQFPISTNQLATVQTLFPLSSKKTLDEVYFDWADFALLKNDTWLRKRNNTFELKYRKPENRGQQLEIYEELSGDEKIADFLAIPNNQKLRAWIETHLRPVMSIKTTRHTFSQAPFTIDVDLTDFDYNVCEIEYVGEKTPQEAQAEILKLAHKIGLEDKLVRNKAKACVEKNYPELAQELILSGVL